MRKFFGKLLDCVLITLGILAITLGIWIGLTLVALLVIVLVPIAPFVIYRTGVHLERMKEEAEKALNELEKTLFKKEDGEEEK